MQTPKPATLYTDASKYTYARVLTQNNDSTDHPITYVSGLFRASQLNWATLTKEAYTFYMSVKNSASTSTLQK